MNFDQIPPPIKRSDPQEVYKQALSDQILRMPKGASLEAMADLLGAREFLTFNARHQTWNFNAKGFIEKSAKEKFAIRLPDNITTIPQTILPPIEGGAIVTGSGAGMEAKANIPRTRFLMEVLQEMNLGYDVIEGTNDSRMMRRLSYRAFVVKSIDRVILVNDEEGNATFIVFHTSGAVDELGKIFSSTKEDLRHQPNVESIIYTGEPETWKDKIKMSLLQSEPVQHIQEKPHLERKTKKPNGYWANISLEELIKEIERRGLDPKNLPIQDVLMHGNYDLLAGLERRFGGLNKAREKLGGKITRRPNGYWQNLSLDEVKDETRSRGFDPENLPSRKVLAIEHSDLVAGLSIRFGSLSQARIELGGKVVNKPNGYWLNLSLDEFREEVKKRGFDPNNLPSRMEMRKNNLDLVGGLRQKFGGLLKAREAFRTQKSE